LLYDSTRKHLKRLQSSAKRTQLNGPQGARAPWEKLQKNVVPSGLAVLATGYKPDSSHRTGLL
jgi:hypothetical protein